MTIFVNGKPHSEQEYSSEAELRDFLEKYPDLLVGEDEPRLFPIGKEVQLPAAGTLDLLLVDEEGSLVAVEVKLAKNSQSRREVLAQAFDYASDLCEHSMDDLNDLLKGELERRLSALDPNDVKNLWDMCWTKLKAGLVKVIVAVDQPNEALRRIVQYINDHSELDVRLVAIGKVDSGNILVPTILVSGNYKASVVHGRRTDPYLDEVIKSYDAQAGHGMKTRGRSPKYRQIKPDAWRGAPVHYELVNYSDETGVELHLEGEAVAFLVDMVKELQGKVYGPRNIPAVWDAKWTKYGRLVVKCPKADMPPQDVAATMEDLIGKTCEDISRALNGPATTGNRITP